MREIHRSALVPHTAGDMFELVNDVESYPRFLPWCRGSAVRELGENDREASLEFSRAGLHRRFTTRNRLEPARAIRMDLVDGPFRVLEGRWSFQPLEAAGAEAGSKVALDLRFEFASRVLEAVFAPVFAEVMNSLVDAFVARARELHHAA